tara:strand:+ start:3665 stop:4603 length:939 start_codon:yes stop_codon:yes gene_type:complete
MLITNYLKILLKASNKYFSEAFCNRRISIILLMMFSSSIGFCQNYITYYKLINDAEISVLDHDFQRADSIYDRAFKEVPNPFKEDLFMAALNSERLSQFDQTHKYLRQAVLKGLILERIRKKFKSFKKTPEWKLLKKEYNELFGKYILSLKTPLKLEVEEMIKNDQKARMPIFGSWRQMKKIDSYNYNRLLEIIEYNNDKWPGFSIIGENTNKGKYDVSGNIALLVLHFKDEWIEELQPYMLEAVLEGQMYPYHYARIMDYRKTCQVYGTYLGGNLSEICNCEEANIKRDKIGFEPIEDYYRKRGSKFVCRN